MSTLILTEYEVHDLASELHAKLSQTGEGERVDQIEIHPDEGRVFPIPREEFKVCEDLLFAIKVLVAHLDAEIHDVAGYTC